MINTREINNLKCRSQYYSLLISEDDDDAEGDLYNKKILPTIVSHSVRSGRKSTF